MRVEAIETFLRSLMVFFYLFAPSEVFSGILLLVSIITFVMVLGWPSFVRPEGNYFRAGSTGTHVVVSAVAFVVSLLKPDSSAPMIATLCLVPFVFAASSYLMYLRIKSVRITSQGTDVGNPAPTLEKQASRLSTEVGIVFKDDLEIAEAAITRCRMDNDVFLQASMCTVSYEKGVPHRASLGKAIYEQGLKKFPNSKMLYIRYVLFLAFVRDDTSNIDFGQHKKVLARTRQMMTEALNDDLFADLRYAIFFVVKKWEQASSAQEAGKEGKIGVLEMIKYKHDYRGARRSHGKCLLAACKFWKMVQLQKRAGAVSDRDSLVLAASGKSSVVGVLKKFLAEKMATFEKEATKFYQALLTATPEFGAYSAWIWVLLERRCWR